MLVYGDGHEWDGDGAERARQIDTAVREATKEGTLTPTAVHLSGVGPATLDLQALGVRHHHVRTCRQQRAQHRPGRRDPSASG
jgi:uncharacterized membrane protein YdfJ with MMPL/SSD domain